jgi:hypothetical protein
VESGAVKYVCSFAIGLGLMCAVPVMAQQSGDIPDVPSQSKLDMTTASQLRPQLMALSSPGSGRYGTARLVFDQLIAQVRDPYHGKIEWQLRIVDDNQLNAYSSPDGSVYVESGLASLAGSSAGLWAAILSHEIAHVVRRDWARRSVYQKYLEHGGGASIVLGDPSLPSVSWERSEKASADMGRFGRQMELEADREGLMMMAHAGYHPDFVPALHHLLHARGMGANKRSMYAMHPCWEERDRELTHAYLEASIEFARQWPEWYASPGGNPPVVVFADEPSVRKTPGKEWQIQIPMRCQNLAGAVEVVLGSGPAPRVVAMPDQPESDGEADPNLRQLTGCTSPKTTITFALGDAAFRQKPGRQWTDIYVLDSWGSVLARTELPKLPH